jgi:SdpC family antimicrobial peptide
VGPVADANPAIVRYLGFSATRPKVNMAALDRLVTDYLRHDKTFHAQVLVPVQSGDPARVEVALTRFSKTFLAFMKASLPPNTVLDAKGNLTTTTPALAKQAMAQGVTGFKLYVAAAAVVLANAVVYANVGVATNAVATLVIVWWYLMEDPAQVNDFERQQFVSLMTNSLRGR